MDAATAAVKIPIFAGIGTSVANSPEYRTTAISDASSPLGSLLLSSCYHAFTTELASLTAVEQALVDIDISIFSSQLSLMSLPDSFCSQNPVISNSFLFLAQSLRYLVYAESLSSQKEAVPFCELLQRNAELGVGILGFSLGILPACAVASSKNLLEYINRAVEMYKVTLWIGIRVQIHRVRDLTGTHAVSSSWSLVFVGMGKEDAMSRLTIFNATHSELESSLYLTAVLNDKTVTISGRPDILQLFLASVDQSLISVTSTHVNALYHAYSAHLFTKLEVLSDIKRRGINVPTASDLIAPLASTFSGDIINSVAMSLSEVIIDMILAQPVNWDSVTSLLADRLASAGIEDVELVSIGPGDSWAKGLERSLTGLNVRVAMQDLPSGARGKLEPIAIVGMAVNMSGSPNIEELWKLLENGSSTLSKIPMSRFDISLYNPFNLDVIHSNRIQAHTGNFISNPGAFDNKFFNISPREAKTMDPQQRILLHTAQEALEDAGYVPDATKSYRRGGFGCYIGAATGDYAANLEEDVDVYCSTGNLRSFLSGRISYAMKWSGPSVVVDTACSSSLVAIHQACRALDNGDCDAALAGGVNIIAGPDMFMTLDRGHFLSPTGQCKPFDASADGYSRSEGCGLFVLKRLSDAVTENDRILGVIRGTEVNQSGNASSITRPDVDTQTTLFQTLMSRSGIDPGRVSVVEAHGTGTQAGDICEMESIRRIFGSAARRARENLLHVTAVKANIGHLEAASGSAGLAKLLLMMRHRSIPPLISLKKLNPAIGPLEPDGIVLAQEMGVWRSGRSGMARIAVLNNFGAAGSNATLLLEEYQSQSTSNGGELSIPFVFAFSGKTTEAVEELRARYILFLEDSNNDSVRLCDISYTATARRQIYGCRLAVSGSTKSAVIGKLKTATISTVTSTTDPRVVFVFSGQGRQYPGMGSQLYKTCPLFKLQMDYCQSILLSLGFDGMLDVILNTPETTFRLESYQTAMFSLEYSLAKLWMSWGVQPIAVMGHSLGEYVALAVAGVLSLNDALVLVANRARLMVERCIPNATGMLAVSLDPGTLSSFISCPSVSIACYNSSSACVLAGPVAALTKLKKDLVLHSRCQSTFLDVPFAYHSAAVDPILESITSIAHNIVLHTPNMTVISNVLGDAVPSGDSTTFTADYFARHCRGPVLFTQGIDSYLEKYGAVDVWIEIGPHYSCLNMLATHENVPKDARFLPSLRKGQESWMTLTESLTQLHLCSVPVRWREAFRHVPSATPVQLPSYPFKTMNYWVPYNKVQPQKKSKVPNLVKEFKMLHSRTQSPTWMNGRVAIFTTPIRILSSFIQGHVVGERALCPASVYLELAFSSIQLVLGSDVILSNVEYTKPLVYDCTVANAVVVTVTVVDDHSGMFSICSTQNSDLHCHGRYSVRITHLLHIPELPNMIACIVENQDVKIEAPEVFSARTVYEVLFQRVVQYSKEYQTIQKITVANSGISGYAVVKLPRDYDRGLFIVHPIFMDTLVHVAGFLSNFQGQIGDAYVCSRIEHCEVLPELIDNDAKYGVYCRNACAPGDGSIIGEVYAVKLGEAEKVVAVLKGVHFRKLRLRSLIRGLALAAGDRTELERPGLRRGSTAGASYSGASESVTVCNSSIDYHEAVVKAIADACHLEPSEINLESNLASLGLDSLMFIEITSVFRDLDPSLNFDALRRSVTIGDMVRAVTGDRSCYSSPTIFTQPASAVRGIHPSSSHVETDLNHIGVNSPMLLEMSDTLPRNGFPFDTTTPSIPCLTIVDIPGERSPANPTGVINRSRAVSIQLPIEEPTVASLLANVLGLEQTELGPDDDLHTLGLDSLISIEAIHLFQNEFQVSLPQNFFDTNRTAIQVEARIQRLSQLSMRRAQSLSTALILNPPCVSIQTSNRPHAIPLFLIHDGSGLIQYYERLTSLDRNVFGVPSPRFVSGTPWESVSEIGEEYAQAILKKSCGGPVILGGWSFGGIIAFEIACELIQQGVEVKGILLIDAPSPLNHVPLTNTLLGQAVRGLGDNTETAKMVRKQFKLSSLLLGEYKPRKMSVYPRVAFLRSREGFRLDPGVLSFGETIPGWLVDREDARAACVDWECLIGDEVKMWDIPGNHFQPFFSENVEQVSQRMLDACNFLDPV